MFAFVQMEVKRTKCLALKAIHSRWPREIWSYMVTLYSSSLNLIRMAAFQSKSMKGWQKKNTSIHLTFSNKPPSHPNHPPNQPVPNIRPRPSAHHPFLCEKPDYSPYSPSFTGLHLEVIFRLPNRGGDRNEGANRSELVRSLACARETRLFRRKHKQM